MTFLCVKNIYNCNLNCWFCSTFGEGHLTENQVIELYKQYKPNEMLLIGGEPLLLPPSYYLTILNNNCKLSIQSNLTLYNDEWNKVFLHKNFTGLSVSGDKEDINLFFEKYQKVCNVTNTNPGILILFSDNFEKSKEKLWEWLNIAYACDLPVKFNIIQPIGKAEKYKDSILKISEGFKLYSLILDEWESTGFIDIQPFTDLMTYICGNEKSICPFCINCSKNESIISIETDLTTTYCPELGDLRRSIDELDLRIPSECFCCDFYQLCRGCYMRTWAVNVENDINYCQEAKRFFGKLYDLKEKYKNERYNLICKTN